jgi:hypothetical protein
MALVLHWRAGRGRDGFHDLRVQVQRRGHKGTGVTTSFVVEEKAMDGFKGDWL